MIDIHAHILPGVDDGPSHWDQSLALIRQGAEDGIRGAVCTSHVLDNLDAGLEQILTDRFIELKKRVEAAGIEMALWLASEIYCQARFEHTSPVATYNNAGKYSLVELPLGQIPRESGEFFFKLSLNGITPILAHPERNRMLNGDPETAWDLYRKKIFFQINAGSITGQFGRDAKKNAFLYIENGLAAFVASDCHHASKRPMVLSEARKVVSAKWGEATAVNLFEINPLKVVSGEEIEYTDPPPLSMRRSLLKRLFST